MANHLERHVCGESMLVDGPHAAASCDACGRTVGLDAHLWRALLTEITHGERLRPTRSLEFSDHGSNQVAHVRVQGVELVASEGAPPPGLLQRELPWLACVFDVEAPEPPAVGEGGGGHQLSPCRLQPDDLRSDLHPLGA